MRSRVVLITVAAVSLTTAACSGGGGKGPEKAASLSPTSTAVSDGAVTPDGPPAVLTGVPDSGGASASRPSIAVKIDNAPEARPQSGLDVADVVYEEVVEGGVTRFIAI